MRAETKEENDNKKKTKTKKPIIRAWTEIMGKKSNNFTILNN